MMTTDPVELADLLGEDVTTRPPFQVRDAMTPWPHVLLVVDGVALPAEIGRAHV